MAHGMQQIRQPRQPRQPRPKTIRHARAEDASDTRDVHHLTAHDQPTDSATVAHPTPPATDDADDDERAATPAALGARALRYGAVGDSLAFGRAEEKVRRAQSAVHIRPVTRSVAANPAAIPSAEQRSGTVR